MPRYCTPPRGSLPLGDFTAVGGVGEPFATVGAALEAAEFGVRINAHGLRMDATDSRRGKVNVVEVGSVVLQGIAGLDDLAGQ